MLVLYNQNALYENLELVIRGGRQGDSGVMQDKYKEEIEEILRKAGEAAPDKSARKSERPPEDRPRDTLASQRTPAQRPQRSPRRWTISSGKLMLAGLVLLLLGWLVVRPLIWIGLIVLVAGYVLYFLKPRSMQQEKRWRGRSVEDAAASPWDWLKRRFKG